MSDLVIIADEAKALGGGLNGYREAVQRYLLRALAAKGFFEEIEPFLINPQDVMLLDREMLSLHLK